MDLLFSLAEIKLFQSNHGVFKSLLSTNQNRALIIMKFLSFLISTNQNRLSMVMEFSINFMSTNQNLVLLFMGFSSLLISFVDIKDFFTGSICGSNQSE